MVSVLVAVRLVSVLVEVRTIAVRSGIGVSCESPLDTFA
jgi:hypothetical protein